MLHFLLFYHGCQGKALRCHCALPILLQLLGSHFDYFRPLMKCCTRCPFPSDFETAKQSVFFSKSVKKSVKRALRVLHSRSARASLPRSRSLFSASFQTLSLTTRAYLNTQKYGLFCSLSDCQNFASGNYSILFGHLKAALKKVDL